MSETTVTAARDHLGRLVDEAMGGGQVVLTRHGRRIAQIVPLPTGAYGTSTCWKPGESGDQLNLEPGSAE